MKTPYITDIQRFSTHDGPGIRTVVFISGCPLDCAWCHNPEARIAKPGVFYVSQNCAGCGMCGKTCPNGCHTFDNVHIFDRKSCVSCGKCCDVCPSGALAFTAKKYTVDEIIGIASRDKVFYREEGGITLSGGEPLMFPDFTLSLLKSAREAEMTADIETCGYADSGVFEKIAPYTDLLLYDIKDTDSLRHKKYTGVFPEKIHKNLLYADSLGIKTLLRCIMVKGVNMDDGHYEGINRLFSKLKNCAGVELLPYHAYGSSKREQLGLESEAHREWIPSAEDMAYAKEKIKNIII